MKNGISVLIFLGIFVLSGCSRHLCCSCGSGALIRLKQRPIPVYRQPGKSVFDTIIDDTMKENYHLLTVKKISREYAYIGVEDSDRPENQGQIIYGWVSLEAVAIRPAISCGNMYLYKRPDTRSKVQSIVRDPQWDYYLIKKCCGEWLYVEYEFEGVCYSGWMRPEDQCCNPFSNCN